MSRAQLTSTVEQNTGGAVAPFVAGKNAIINGGMDIWQRGTSSTLNLGYGSADRWYQYIGTGTGTFAQESTVVPLGSRYSIKFTSSNASANASITQYMETSTCSPFIGKTISVSVQVAASTSTAIALTVAYSTTVDAGAGSSWTTITATSGGTATPTSTTFVTLAGVYAVPSNANSIRVILNPSSNIGNGVVVYYGNAQLELGSVATAFSRAGGTLQGELAACQRYYWSLSGNIQQSASVSGNSVVTNFAFPVQMRTTPTVITNMTGSNYFTTASPWLWVQLGIAPCSLSTGTVTVLTIATNQQVALCTNTGTFNPTPNGFQINGTSFYLNASAEL